MAWIQSKFHPLCLRFFFFLSLHVDKTTFFFFMSSVASYTERRPTAVYHSSNDGTKQIVASEPGIKPARWLSMAHQEEEESLCTAEDKSLTRPPAVSPTFMNAIWTLLHFSPSPSRIRASLASDGVWESGGATCGRSIVLPVGSLKYDVWTHPSWWLPDPAAPEIYKPNRSRGLIKTEIFYWRNAFNVY